MQKDRQKKILLRYGIIWLAKNRSKTFEKALRTLIGLYFSLFSLSVFLNAGVTQATFSTLGKIDSPLRVELIRSERGPEITREAKIINLGGTSSVPID